MTAPSKIQLDTQQCLCFHLRQNARHVTQRYDEALRSSGLRITQFTLLAGVEAMGPSALLRLAENMGMDRTTLTRNLAPLQRSGLIEIRQGRQDRREREIRLTPAGRRTFGKARPLWERAQEEMMQRLGEAAALPAFSDILTLVDAVGDLARLK